MKKKERKWIFLTLLLIGIISSFVVLAYESNIFFKNGDFTKKIYIELDEGDGGYLQITRNILTPSVADWIVFEKNNEDYMLISEQFVNQNVLINLPDNIESGLYYFNIEGEFTNSGKIIKEIKFRII